MKLKHLLRKKFRPNPEAIAHRIRQQRNTPAQEMTELAGFLRLIVERDVRSYLEIGCRYGGTFNMVMRLLPPGSRGVAVDLPGGNWGRDDSARHLSEIVDDLKTEGYDTHLVLGDSRDDQIRAAVAALGPFDAALLDGDHLYDGVQADWHNYGPMARMVAFHDVAGDGVHNGRDGMPVEVPKFWRELKAREPETIEIVGRDSIMGIGVVVRQSVLQSERCT